MKLQLCWRSGIHSLPEGKWDLNEDLFQTQTKSTTARCHRWSRSDVDELRLLVAFLDFSSVSTLRKPCIFTYLEHRLRMEILHAHTRTVPWRLTLGLLPHKPGPNAPENAPLNQSSSHVLTHTWKRVQVNLGYCQTLSIEGLIDMRWHEQLTGFLHFCLNYPLVITHDNGKSLI